MIPFKKDSKSMIRLQENPRPTVKVRGAVVQDAYSGAVPVNVVGDYSAQVLAETLKKFAEIRGSPAVKMSDPGSQLEPTARKQESWWTKESSTKELAGQRGFQRIFNLDNSQWRQ